MNDIDKLLEKYWNAETSIEEERVIKKHFKENDNIDELGSMFSFFEQEKTIKYKGDVSIGKNNSKEAKLVKVNFLKKIAVAASILLVLGIGGFLSKDRFSSNTNSYTKNEIKDPEKARKIAEEALAMLASNYAKGENTLSKSMKSFEKVTIINSLIKSN